MTKRQMLLIDETRALARMVIEAGVPIQARIGHANIVGFPEIDVLASIYAGIQIPRPMLHVSGVVLFAMPKPEPESE
jgi:hypothetical protein